jgi:hypothetical protein
MSDQVSAVRARQQEIERLKWLLENASAAPWCLDDHVVHPGDSPNQWHIYERLEDDPPLFTTGMGTRDDAELVVLLRNLAPDLLPIVDAALRAVPLAAETEGLPKMIDIPMAWELTRATKPNQHHERCSYRVAGMLCDCAAMRVMEKLSGMLKALAAPNVAQAPTRCPYCSFDPTSMNDYCAEHRPVRREAPEGAAPAGATAPPQNAVEVVQRLIDKIERQAKMDLTIGEEIVVLSALRGYVTHTQRLSQEALAAPAVSREAEGAHNENEASRLSGVKPGCFVTREPQTIGHAADDGGSVGPRSTATDKPSLVEASVPQGGEFTAPAWTHRCERCGLCINTNGADPSACVCGSTDWLRLARAKSRTSAVEAATELEREISQHVGVPWNATTRRVIVRHFESWRALSSAPGEREGR